MVGNVKARKMTWSEIRQKAEEFRNEYVKPVNRVPVPIEEIVEIDLGIRPWPIDRMLEKIDIDGFISNDLKNIFIDNRIYSDIRFENRLRFTYAEEVGHLVLHKEAIENCEFRTEQDWVKYREDMPEEEISWFFRLKNSREGFLFRRQN